MKRLREIVTHPASLVAGVLSLAGIAVKPALIHIVWAVVWSQIGSIFTGLSLAAFTILPRIPMPSWLQSVGVGAALIAGAIYAAKLLDGVIERVQDQIDK
ncbi:MAG: hypothetical protein ABEI57_00665 [Halapricum sp.]